MACAQGVGSTLVVVAALPRGASPAQGVGSTLVIVVIAVVTAAPLPWCHLSQFLYSLSDGLLR